MDFKVHNLDSLIGLMPVADIFINEHDENIYGCTCKYLQNPPKSTNCEKWIPNKISGKWKTLKCRNRSMETEVQKGEEKPPISV